MELILSAKVALTFLVFYGVGYAGRKSSITNNLEKHFGSTVDTIICGFLGLFLIVGGLGLTFTAPIALLQYIWG